LQSDKALQNSSDEQIFKLVAECCRDARVRQQHAGFDVAFLGCLGEICGGYEGAFLVHYYALGVERGARGWVCLQGAWIIKQLR
jgi:hypothetical protein